MFREGETTTAAFGHICQGGGARIVNSPISVHIHIHSNEISLVEKMGRIISGIINRERHVSIENASRLSEPELQRRVIRTIENG